jgi:flagellar biosynthesis/type III secretory pathway M-ring protein FliF/YscJ
MNEFHDYSYLVFVTLAAIALWFMIYFILWVLRRREENDNVQNHSSTTAPEDEEHTRNKIAKELTIHAQYHVELEAAIDEIHIHSKVRCLTNVFHCNWYY